VDPYFIATIVLASTTGCFAILLVITWCCCCRYQSKLKHAGDRVLFRKPDVVSNRLSVMQAPAPVWGVNPYDMDILSSPTTSKGGCRACQGQGLPSCQHCHGQGAAQDWIPNEAMFAMPSTNLNAYSPAPTAVYSPAPIAAYSPPQIAQQPVIGSTPGRVVLNAPALSAAGPVSMNTKLNVTSGGGGAYNNGGMSGAYNNMGGMSGGNGGYNQGAAGYGKSCDGAQFVLESLQKPY